MQTDWVYYIYDYHILAWLGAWNIKYTYQIYDMLHSIQMYINRDYWFVFAELKVIEWQYKSEKKQFFLSPEQLDEKERKNHISTGKKSCLMSSNHKYKFEKAIVIHDLQIRRLFVVIVIMIRKEKLHLIHR